MTPRTEPALRLTVVVRERDTWHHRPVHAEIVHRARAAGLAGASVFGGVEGLAASSLIRTNRPLSPSEDLPVAIVVVDDEARVRAFLPRPDDPVEDSPIVPDACEVVRRTCGAGGTS
ncbi:MULTISPECIES: DUF190 domain-containing protein [unclassified Streptomyces]|uniref:DUF190 domain-containing protein n=1 Tax=unclassified Streptomyces TaxID=2593676 RepID=UPI00190464EC|nr:DUF190 domain-containing protein [Streptomyces sp. HSG2]